VKEKRPTIQTGTIRGTEAALGYIQKRKSRPWGGTGKERVYIFTEAQKESQCGKDVKPGTNCVNGIARSRRKKCRESTLKRAYTSKPRVKGKEIQRQSTASPKVKGNSYGGKTSGGNGWKLR